MAGNGNLIATFEVRVLVRQNQRHWATTLSDLDAITLSITRQKKSLLDQE